MDQYQRDYYYLFIKQQNYQFLSAGLALFGLVLAVYDYEMQLRMHTTVLDDQAYPQAADHP